jgi:RNA polymerase sigma factor (sigma-70 family)
MSREEEFHLFRKMNYLKFRAYRLRHGLDPQTATLARVEEIESMENDAARIRNFIIESNLRLVTSRAKQFARTTGLPLDELISEGNIGLVQAVEHFDFARGTKLSTYATWAVTNKLLAFMQKARRQSAHFVGEHGVSLDAFEGSQESTEDSLANAEVREKLTSFLSRLKDRERAAVEYRFGLTENGEARTLKELASEWGVTKQRAQQVCASAVNKLRLMLQQEGLFALWN